MIALTPKITAGFPLRIAFYMYPEDSIHMIDSPVATELRGRGDLIAELPGPDALQHLQSIFVSSHELPQLTLGDESVVDLDAEMKILSFEDWPLSVDQIVQVQRVGLGVNATRAVLKSLSLQDLIRELPCGKWARR